MPRRQASLARGRALKPGAPLRRRAALEPGKAPAPVSRRRRREAAQRAEVVQVTRERAGDRCELVDVVPEVRCWHPAGVPLFVNEKARRARRPGCHLDAGVTNLVCAGHDAWQEAHPAEAERRGLLWPSER